MKFLFYLLATIVVTSHAYSQVHLNSGRAEFSYPFFNYNDPDRLRYSLSLNYTGGNGIKVDEIASDVGLGWRLSSGGSVSRRQVGEPDDQSRPTGSFLLSGYLYSTYPATTDCPLILGWIPLTQGFGNFTYVDADAADKEQDIFSFIFNDKSGSFVISKEGVCVSLTNSRLKIEKVIEDMSVNNIVTRISKFIITDDDGIQYTFSEKQLSRVYRYGYSNSDAIGVTVPPGSGLGFCTLTYESALLSDYSIVTDWFLTEIKNPLTNNKITITYEGYDLSYVGGRRPSFSKTYDDAGDYRTNILDSRERFTGIAKRIKAVSLPDNKTIDFTYNTYDRVDMPGTKSLKDIQVKQDGTQMLLGFDFSYKYFSLGDMRDINYAFSASEAPNARMCLSSVRKIGPDNVFDKPYEFSYYQGPNSSDKEYWVPPRNSIMQDYFGYYNGIPEGSYDGSNIYETAELVFTNLNYKFGSNRNNFPYNDPIRLPGGAIHPYVLPKNGALKSVKYPNGGSVEYEYEPNKSSSLTGEKVMGGVRVKKVIVHDAVNTVNDMITEYKYVLEDGTSSGWGYEEPVFRETKRTVYKRPSGSGNYTASAVSLAMGIAPSLIHTNIPAIAGDIQEPIRPRRYPPIKDYKWMQLKPIVDNIAAMVLLKIFVGGGNSITNIDSEIASYIPFISANSLPFSYSRVEVYKGSVVDNMGKTVYEYTSDNDYPVLVPILAKPYSNRPRTLDWAYGLLKKQAIYNKNNQLVKLIENKYAIYQTKSGSPNSRCVPTQTFMSTVADQGLRTNYITFASDYYYQVYGRADLTSTIERTYDLSGNYSTSRIDYTYDQSDFLLKEINTTNERGERIQKKFYYPQDYTVSGALQQMKTANVIFQPVSAETWLYKSTTDKRLVDSYVNEFQIISNGDFRPVKRYQLRASTTLQESLVQPFDPAQLVRSALSGYMKQDIYSTFNNNGSPAEIVQDNRITSMIYDNNGINIIANAENATQAGIAYSSFEQLEDGNWTFIGSPLFVSDVTAPTGNRCLSASSITRLEKTGLAATKTYIVSYWLKGGAITVSGGNNLEHITGETINGWTMHQLRISGTQTITLSGSGNIDELRLYPSDGRFSTKTHNISGNITSECGTDNIILKYEFDELGRPLYVKDQYGNILNYTQYRYKL